MPRSLFAVLACWCLFAADSFAQPSQSHGMDFFEKKIRPVLVEHFTHVIRRTPKKFAAGSFWIRVRDCSRAATADPRSS